MPYGSLPAYPPSSCWADETAEQMAAGLESLAVLSRAAINCLATIKLASARFPAPTAAPRSVMSSS